MVNNDFFISRTGGSYANTPAPSVIDKEPAADKILSSLKYRDRHSLTRQEKRILKKEFSHQLKKYIAAKMSGRRDNADKALLTILAIIAALGLSFLLMLLVCSLSCNGAEGAAVVLGIIGVTGIVLGTYFLIKRISHGPKNKIKSVNAEPEKGGNSTVSLSGK